MHAIHASHASIREGHTETVFELFLGVVVFARAELLQSPRGPNGRRFNAAFGGDFERKAEAVLSNERVAKCPIVALSVTLANHHIHIA